MFRVVSVRNTTCCEYAPGKILFVAMRADVFPFGELRPTGEHVSRGRGIPHACSRNTRYWAEFDPALAIGMRHAAMTEWGSSGCE